MAYLSLRCLSNTLKLSQNSEQIIVLQPILTELKGKEDKVCEWVATQHFPIESITSEMNQEALTMEGRYQTGRSQRGANSVDIQLISWAKITGNTIVTCESHQPNLPGKLYNYKIPAICKQESVRCILFVDLLRELSISL